MDFKFFKVNLLNFCIVFRERFKKGGLIWFIIGIFKFSIREISWVVLLPASIILHLGGIRCLNVRLEHIGHLALEPDALIKEYILNKSRRKIWILLSPIAKISNKHLLKYWKKNFITIESPFLCIIIKIMSRHMFMNEDVSRYISKFFGPQDVFTINSNWGTRGPLLSLTEEDENWANKKFLN